MSDERVRAAYTRAVSKRVTAERATCPAPETMLELVRREGGEEQRLAVLDHLMVCAACGEEFELLRAIERGGRIAGTEEKASPVGAVPPTWGRVVGHITWRRLAPLAAAAAILLMVTVGPARDLWLTGGDTARGAADPLALNAPADGTTTTAGTTMKFSWQTAPGAERYTLELLSSGGLVAVSRTLADTTLLLTLPATLSAGDYRWWVIATGGGSELRSATRTLRVRER